jgi:ribosomal protein L11 methyltransferase
MISVFCQLEERLLNPLFEVFDGGDFVLTSWKDVEEPLSIAEIFLEDPGKTAEAEDALRKALQVIGSNAVPAVRTIPDEDWKFSYRRFFHTDVISQRLVVRPPWEEFQPAPGQSVLTLDPGMAFGTGRHETTRTCLEFIDELAVEGCRTSLLDMGTGSGILAIAACKLGFEKVDAFDNDPDAVSVAMENASLNNVKIGFEVSDLEKNEKKADVVVANILAPVLIEYAAEIAYSVNRTPSARLILSGILATEYRNVAAAFERHGFEEMYSALSGEWLSGIFRRAAGR